MVWLKADSSLVNTYKKLIAASRAEVDWQGEILIQNNIIILPGSINSFIFDFELKRVYPNIVDIPEVHEEIFAIEGRKLLANIFNLFIYIFGKWGVLSGVKISHSYAKIDLLFKQILKEVNAESYYSDSGIKFTMNGLSVVFEDIITVAMDKIKADEESEGEEVAEEGPQGLWHDMQWKALRESFNKEELDDKKIDTDRLGSNFYMIPYICPNCSNHLHMSVYPNGEEFPIDTEEGKIYIARVYMCPECCRFYTPRPRKLLSDGEVYILDFDNDEKATEDYKKLIGKKGKKTANSNFNMYESEYMNKMRSGNRSLAKICSRIKEISDEDLERLLAQMEEGFFSENEIELFLEYIRQELEYRRNARLNYDSYDKEEISIADGLKEDVEEYISEEDEPEEDDDMMDVIVKSYMNGTGDIPKEESLKRKASDKDYVATKRKKESHKTKEKRETRYSTKADFGNKAEYGAQTGVNYEEEYNVRTDFDNEEEYSTRADVIDEEKDGMETDTGNDEAYSTDACKKEVTNNSDKSEDIGNLDSTDSADSINSGNTAKNIFINKETVIREIKASRNKKYSDIQKLASDVKNSSLSSEDKEELTVQLKSVLEQIGTNELNNLVAHIPQGDSKERYKRIKERIKSYKEIDTSKYEELVDKLIQNAERAELSAMVKRAGTSDRHRILELIESLKNADFTPLILKEYSDELYEKVRDIDTETVRSICPNMSALDVENGIRVMHEIEAADILPELKSEMNALIDKRLTRMKTEESEQLVEKLKRVLDRSIEDNSRIHYYSAKKMQEGDNTDSESILIRNAISKYALLGRYEYPIIICDSSLLGNGKDGFIITPDHIFYKGIVKSGQLDVLDIEDISSGNGKALSVNRKSEKKLKLPCSLKNKDLKNMGSALNDFVTYLKAKPESRNIAYMAQEKHAVICCYRCGHVFREGKICPKCGSRNN